MSDEQKMILERELWKIANLLRGKMNADEYKNYILGFIFYKYLSEKQEIYVNEILGLKEELGIEYLNLDESIDGYEEYLEEIEKASLGRYNKDGEFIPGELGFFLKPNELFNYIIKKGNQGNYILDDLKNALNSIENRTFGKDSEEDFIGLFEDVDLNSPKLGKREEQKNHLILDILTHLAEIDFDIKNPKNDILGDAYEYLIGEFAADSGKKGGEFYTPAQVSKILAQIVTLNRDEIKSIYDPTCGSGSLLIRANNYSKIGQFYGQELNRTTYNLARMNMLLHGIHHTKFSIRQGDTLTDDKFPDLKAGAIVANPPFSAKWKGKDDVVLVNDDRFSAYGALAPKSSADYAFVTHMLYHLADDGVMAVVLPHGVLFRGGAEEKIRRAIIEKFNYLDAVIGLASNLFYGTSIPATILVFKKCRERDDVLFIDASKLYEKGKNQNYLKEEHIKKIIDTYKERKEIEKFSHLASLEEIKENDFNLNIPRYVDTFEEEEPINIDEVSEEIKILEEQQKEINKKIEKFCNELGIKPPFGALQ